MVYVNTETVLLPGSYYETSYQSACRTRLINCKWRYLPNLFSWNSFRIICEILYLKSSTSNVYFVRCMHAIFRRSWPSCTRQNAWVVPLWWWITILRTLFWYAYLKTLCFCPSSENAETVSTLVCLIAEVCHMSWSSHQHRNTDNVLPAGWRGARKMIVMDMLAINAVPFRANRIG
jgi:hypothetical protein